MAHLRPSLTYERREARALAGFRSKVFVEEAASLRGARVAWRSKPPPDETLACDDLCARAAVVSLPMLEPNAVARPMTTGDIRLVARPDDYGRAVVVNLDRADEPAAWNEKSDRLVDVKGVGVPAGRRPLIGQHTSGVLRLDEAIFEAVVATFLNLIAPSRGLCFEPIWPLAILDAGFRTRSLPGLRGRPLTPAALLVRPFCNRPKFDMPFAQDRDHVAYVWAMEFDLIRVGLTSMAYVFYQLERLSEDAILVRTPSSQTAHRRRQARNFEYLETLLGGRRRRAFHYPNIQFGFKRDGARAVLIDLGSIAVCENMNSEWMLRALGCEYQFVKVEQSIVNQALARAKGAATALSRVTHEFSTRYRALLRRRNYEFASDWGADFEIISAGISCLYEDQGRDALDQIDAVAAAMADAVLSAPDA